MPIDRINPRSLFLIDGIGALISAVLLGLIMPHWVTFFGIPEKSLYILAFIPCTFIIYDIFCYFYGYHSSLSLKLIAFLNLLYCCISIGLVIYKREELTVYGWLYIMIEIVIIIFLVTIELRVASSYGKAGYPSYKEKRSKN